MFKPTYKYYETDRQQDFKIFLYQRHDKLKVFIVFAYIITAIIINLCLRFSGIFNNFDIPVISIDALLNFVHGLSVLGLAVLLHLLAKPTGANRISKKLSKAKIKNGDVETPILIGTLRGILPYTVQYTFFANGTTESEWNENRKKLNSLFKFQISNIREDENNPDRMFMFIRTRKIDEVVYWKDYYLNDEDFTLVLGDGLMGKERVNLNDIPHMLIGGGTGSGKSVLLKNLIFQSHEISRKIQNVYGENSGVEIHINCFKGGVDFPPTWHEKFNIITEKDDLLELLESITAELENRKKLFRLSGCNDLQKYNETNVGNELKRIIIAIDEIADVLEKTKGLSKSDLELIGKIESCLSKIARLGRAFGINLILSTQRPSADLISGQINSNIGLRICGRADSILSKIILDDTEASKLVAKNAKGRFVTNTGKMFQGYLFDDVNCFNNSEDKK